MSNRMIVCLIFAIFLSTTFANDLRTTKPLFKDFMGLCVHTVMFKPDLYRPVCHHVRDYHGMNWDLGDDTDFWPTFPMARNQVNWQAMYGDWVNKGYVIDASIMFGDTPYAKWKNPTRDAETYGIAFARYFGPSNRNLVKAMEIGNEPGLYSDEEYRTIFESMAKGIRLGDPNMLIVTCAADPCESERYAKSVACVQGLEDLYDVINIHTYAQVEGWPTWKRSFPEDPNLDYLKKIERTMAWRDKHAPLKNIWITEFGWDCTTQPTPKEGDFKDWQGSTDLQQAQYLVRSWLIFSGMDIERAYMYWFDDKDLPQVHGASGLTRNYEPKPSYYAVSHLYATLGDYRYTRHFKVGPALVYEYNHDLHANKKIQAVWLPTGSNQTDSINLPLNGAAVDRIERMPLTAEAAQTVSPTISNDRLTLPCSEFVTYVFLREK